MTDHLKLWAMARVEVFRDTVRAVPSLDCAGAVLFWPEWTSLAAAAEAFAAEGLYLAERSPGVFAVVTRGER